jgi:transcriptional regulator with XRE-family HTH domain
MLGIKQEELAVELGITQQAVSLLEGKEVIDPKMLEDVAKVLKVPTDAIKNFNEEGAVNYIANTFHGNSGNYMNFNPLDKVIELYERMIKERDEIIAELKKVKK